MTATRRILSACILLTGVALALGYGLGHLWGGVALAAFGGALWLWLRRRPWGWVSSLMLVLAVAAAALGSSLGLGAAWMVLVVLLALSAWDLDGFLRRVERAGRVEGHARLERAHLQRLAVVAGLGLATALLALLLRINLSFGAALLLGLLGLLGLSQAVQFLRREGGPPRDEAARLSWRQGLAQIAGHPWERLRGYTLSVGDSLFGREDVTGPEGRA